MTTASGSLPELGPLLGRLLAHPVEQESALASLEPVRLELLSALFEKAGAARARIAAGDEAGARETLGPAAWLTAWEQAVSHATRSIVLELERRIREAALISRFPAKRVAGALPDGEDRRLLGGRLSAAGSGLEEAVLLLADPSRSWEESLRRVAGELQAGWERLTATASLELERGERLAAQIRAWRRPWLPVVVAGTVVLGTTLWLGLMLGGYLPVPGWLRPFANWVWNL